MPACTDHAGDGVWSEPSEKVLVSVAYEGVLAAPVVTAPENAQAGERFLASPVQCVVLDSTVETVGERAFANSAELQLVIVKGMNTTFASDAFSGCGDVAFACAENSAAHTFAQSNGIPCFFIAD